MGMKGVPDPVELGVEQLDPGVLIGVIVFRGETPTWAEHRSYTLEALEEGVDPWECEGVLALFAWWLLVGGRGGREEGVVVGFTTAAPLFNRFLFGLSSSLSSSNSSSSEESARSSEASLSSPPLPFSSHSSSSSSTIDFDFLAALAEHEMLHKIKK